jgi:hypothetical protein
MKKKLFALVCGLLLMLHVECNSQNSYTFSKITGNTYTDLSGDIAVPASGFDPNSGLFTIPGIQGETFNFFKTSFTIGGLTAMSMGENPFLRIENDSSLVIVDVAFTYADTIDASSKKSYLLAGSPGSLTVALQYKNLTLQYGQPGNFINGQIWYFQQTGVIELRYGPRSTNNATGFNNIQGPNIGIFYSPLNFSGCYEKLWCEGSSFGPVLDSAANYGFDAMGGVPAEGIIYRFTPRTQTVSTVSVVERSVANALQVLPNPAKGLVTIKGTTDGYQLVVYDLLGKCVKSTQTAGRDLTLDVTELENGCYYLHIQNSHMRVVKKLVVDH